MKIANARIDGRLIHGQVAVLWTRSLNATRIMVVDSESLQNKLRLQMLKMACPTGVKLSVLDPATAAVNLKNEKYKDDTVFIVAKSPETYLAMADNGYLLDAITVGNMGKREGTRSVYKTVCVTETEESALRELNRRGTKLYYRLVFNDEPIDFMPLLDAQH